MKILTAQHCNTKYTTTSRQSMCSNTLDAFLTLSPAKLGRSTYTFGSLKHRQTNSCESQGGRRQTTSRFRNSRQGRRDRHDTFLNSPEHLSAGSAPTLPTAPAFILGEVGTENVKMCAIYRWIASTHTFSQCEIRTQNHTFVNDTAGNAAPKRGNILPAIAKRLATSRRRYHQNQS